MTEPIATHAPPGWHTVTPRIVARNAEALVEFIKHVFSATGTHDASAPSIVTIGDSRIMISEVGVRHATGAVLYVYVADVVATYTRAIERGARSIEAPGETPYGDFRCVVEDGWSNTWQIASFGQAA